MSTHFRKIWALLLSASCNIHGADLEFLTDANLSWAVLDRSYQPSPLEARSFGTCPIGGLGYVVMSGDLPPGIQLSSAGYFSGVPKQTGSYEFVVRVVNGCAWTQKPFTLVVATPPVILASPSRVTLTTASPVAILTVASSWPSQTYSVNVVGDWLEAKAQRGKTASAGGRVFEDQVVLRPKLTEIGKYSATVEISGWQIQPVRVLVEMEINPAE